MNDTWRDEENIRVVRGAEASEVAYMEQRQRSDAQKAQDQIIEKAREAAVLAKESLEEAVEWYRVVVPDFRSTLATEIGQVIEAIDETRRLRQ